ncbi:MAG: glutathione S-transferase family protein [Methyloligellaceae bacterium]
MKLYYFETSNSRKPCAVAKYLESPVEFVRIDLAKGEQKTPEFLGLNPNGKAPALEDGGIKLWESNAIMCHLAVKADSDLWPKDDAKRIDIIRWFNWDTAHFSRHAGRLLFERFIKPTFGLGDADEDEIEEATGFFKQFAGILDDHLQGRDYLVGGELSVADFAVASILPEAKEAQLPLADFGEITRWHDKMMELPAWRDPFPKLREAA